MTCAARVPHDGQRFGIFLREQPQIDFARGRQRAMQIDELAVDFGHDRRLGEPGADFLGDIERGNGAVELFTAAIRQNYGKHECAIRLDSEMAVRMCSTIRRSSNKSRQSVTRFG